MAFINEASGICLSPTGGTGECPTSNPCEGDGYIKSGKLITIANTCNMPLTITGFHNDNPERFTIINYPEFSGSGYYTTGNVTGNPDSLPRILEPGDSWEIMTWWHPKKWEVETGNIGTPARPTGTAQSAKISVLPGDLGFADCANYFTLSGEMVCDKVPITLGTGALGTYVQTLSDLPDPPIPTVCLQSSKYVYESFRVYPNATDLGNDQTQGLYQLMSWIGGQISGNVDEYPRIRNIAKGFTTGVRQVIDAGNDNDLANLFTFSIPLANSISYKGADNVLDPLTGSFKTSTVVPTGSGTLMQLGEGYTGINILESRYDDLGAGLGWQNQDNNYGVYVSSGLVNTSNLMVRMFIAQSGHQSLQAGTTIKNSICTQPISHDLSAGPAIEGPPGSAAGGNFDDLLFLDITKKPGIVGGFTPAPVDPEFEFYILPDEAAVAAWRLYGPSVIWGDPDLALYADPLTCTPLGNPKNCNIAARKGGIIMEAPQFDVSLPNVRRRQPGGLTTRTIVNNPDTANPGWIVMNDPLRVKHEWIPGWGTVAPGPVTSLPWMWEAFTVFDLNDNGGGLMRYAAEWIVNGDIEIAEYVPPYDTVVNWDNTAGPGSLASTNMVSISIEKNLSTDGFIWVKFKLKAAGGGNFILRGAS